MNPRTIYRPRASVVAFLLACLLPSAVFAESPHDVDGQIGSLDLKSLSGSFVVFDPAGGGRPCWAPSNTQSFCFRTESFTPDWEWVDNLWMLFPADWTVVDVAVAGSPVCDNGGWGPFSWSFHTPPNEINIEHQRNTTTSDHCTAVYCLEVTTGPGGGDALVSWYWDGDDFGDPPHWPCSDDGYTPSGQSVCDESTMPRSTIPDCSAFGTLEGSILDHSSSSPTCTVAEAIIDPGGMIVPADGAGDYGPVQMVAGNYDITASAQGYDDGTAIGIPVLPGTATVQDFHLPRPVLDAAPAGLDTTVMTGTTADRIIVLDNLGVSSPLDWTVRELPPTDMVNPLSQSSSLVSVEVEPELDDLMRSRGEAGFMIEFRERPDLSVAFSLGWDERGRFVIDSLMATAQSAQARVRHYLDVNRIEYRAFWIDNIIIVSSSTREVFEGLLAFDEIEFLRAERMMGLIEPVEKDSSDPDGRAVEGNISHILADQVWSMGFDGSGMVVANLDTGVRYTHEVLEPHYRGNIGGGSFDHDYNWLDGVDGSAPAPFDDHGHGSHTMGTMVGDDGGNNQIGMAPGATWIACDACEGTGCPSAGLLTCAQWIMAPYPVGDPGSPDSSKRPHVVNNSWGDCGRSYDGWFQGAVDSWHAAGIYPVFSNGNAGNCGYPSPPECNTVGNPGRYSNVTGVGSTGRSNGVYATHSNLGPTDNLDTVNPDGYPSLKPQVVAPGVDIRSSLNGGDSSYGSWDGTSMSAPHVSGLVALMWAAAPCLVGDYALTETIIQDSVVAIAYPSGCGGEGPGNIPNMATGWGEINALEAVTMATVHCDTDWLPWVAEVPDMGQIPAGDSENITVTFSCGPNPGSETGALRLMANDPCSETTDIPLALHCTDIGEVDLVINKSDGLMTAVPGNSLVYTIGVSNTGPVDAVGATVADLFATVLTGVDWSCGASNGASCTASGSGDIDDTVTVPVGGVLTYTVNGTVSPDADGILSNTATVSAPPGVIDLDPSNNNATDTTELTPEVDLGITKTDGLSSVLPGDPITYTISVTNVGPSSAPGASVFDAFPVFVTGISWSCSASGGASCAVSGSGDINDTVSLPVGGSVVYTATGTVSSAATGTLSNTATVAPPPGVTETNPGNNSATDTTDLTPGVDLGITKTDGLSSITPGNPITYTISVTNAGPSSAPGATVSDTFPVAVTGVSWSCAPSGGASCTVSGSGHINDTVSLPVGGSVVYTATGTVSSAATGTLSNTATVAPPPGVTETNPGNNSATDTTSLTPEADLGVGKTDGLSSVLPGGQITYTISVTNAGPSSAPGATVSDTFPVAVTGIAWSCAASGGASCTSSGSGDINDIVSLPVGGSVVYTATGTVSAAATGTLSNTATVAPPPGVTDTNPSNNSATDTTVVSPAVDLAVTKTDGVDSAVPGESVTYTIVVSNSGPHDAIGAEVADTFPADLVNVTWTCEASAGSSCTASGAGDIADTVTVSVGGTVTYTVVADIDPGALGTVENTAEVQPELGVIDPDPANNSDSDTDTLTPVTDLHGFLNDWVCWLLPGESTTYTLAVFNDGPSDAIGATVVDDPPAILTGVTWTCSASGGASCPTNGTGAINQAVDLPVGGFVEFLLSGTIDPGASGTLVNEASVTPPTGAVDPSPHNAVMWDWNDLQPAVFCDGFNDGSTGGWWITVP